MTAEQRTAYAASPICEECGLPIIACSEIARLKLALKPFAKAHAQFVADHVEAFSKETPSTTPLLIDNAFDAHHLLLTVGDFRRAAEVLDGDGQSAEESK